ncbi:hypothetical protein HAX54_028426, partial [Datura stramonium]|nr:hypothetical protein [Datura stramonium]
PRDDLQKKCFLGFSCVSETHGQFIDGQRWGLNPGSSSANETSILKPLKYLFDRCLYLYGEFAADRSLFQNLLANSMVPFSNIINLAIKIVTPSLSNRLIYCSATFASCP